MQYLKKRILHGSQNKAQNSECFTTLWQDCNYSETEDNNYVCVWYYQPVATSVRAEWLSAFMFFFQCHY